MRHKLPDLMFQNTLHFIFEESICVCLKFLRTIAIVSVHDVNYLFSVIERSCVCCEVRTVFYVLFTHVSGFTVLEVRHSTLF